MDDPYRAASTWLRIDLEGRSVPAGPGARPILEEETR
jgi:hypothetical protein